ncbi:MAG: hypothetical protein SFW62_01730 [Alphaproteobacteria bacterium]|nr:hypothetical protein [Alphaproteobacteria bacterium]
MPDTRTVTSTTVDNYPAARAGESATSGVAWAAIIGGALAAIGVTLILTPLGSALGFAATSPWISSGENMGKAVTLLGVVWLIITQWIASGIGGYLTGRLRTKWAGAHTHEVFFRDTAHGFLTWVLASVLSAMALAWAAGSMASMALSQTDMAQANPLTGSYYSDSLFRPGPDAMATASTVSDQDRMEANRILASGLGDQPMSDEDKTYLARIISTRTGISENEAMTRIDNAMAKGRDALDMIQRNAGKASFFACLALLIGAFIASGMGALGGIHRDTHYESGRLRL